MYLLFLKSISLINFRPRFIRHEIRAAGSSRRHEFTCATYIKVDAVTCTSILSRLRPY